jgi:hypothetical protein
MTSGSNCRHLNSPVQSPVRNGLGTLPVGHMYGVANDHTLTGHTNGVALIEEKSIQN